ncbi:hypothetical protein NT6N_17060 [Oceaniferula spumae]|uniref:Spermatogenesis-associated protein 20-like TRX domain-containing protein n=1 Tax=Oceaniferula spumae TaxID=2979115 RepID=A0AAT9FL11_9BACT
MLRLSPDHIRLPLLSYSAIGIITLGLTNSCKENKPAIVLEPEATEIVIPMDRNNLAQTTGTSSFLHNQADSKVHWQPWSKNVFKVASGENKTVFAFIGDGTDSHSLSILKKINDSPATCAALNSSHINVLVDANQHQDLAFLAASLNVNTGTSVNSPQLVWFSHEGIPVSWTSINNNNELNIHELISRMSNTVTHLWQDDPSYVLSNSRTDFIRRLEAIKPEVVEEDDPIAPIRAVRQAGSMFDPTSNTIDNLIGLFPARYTALMTLSAYHPDISDIKRKNYSDIAKSTAENIILAGLIDPLDGGSFSGIQQATSALPVFAKTLPAQTSTAQALYRLYQLTKDSQYLTAADAILDYTEKNLALPDGGYAMGIIYADHDIVDNPCIWTLEEIEAALTEEETKLCVQAFEISGLGNIPLIDDRNRSYFRKNTLTWKLSMSELATLTGIPQESLKEKLESITKKLAKLRTEKSATRVEEKLTTTDSMAALASAYVSAYRASGNQARLEKAKGILTFIQKNCIDGSGTLQRSRYNGQLLDSQAHGIDYVKVSRAALDLYEVSQDSTWLEWAAKIHQQMNSRLSDAEFSSLSETDGSTYPHPFKIRQFITIKPLNNECTWGIAYSNAKRLENNLGGTDYAKQAHNIRLHLLSMTDRAPLASIDFLTADAQLNLKTVYLKAPASAELLNAALPHACQIVHVTADGSYPGLKDDASKLTSGGAVVKQGDKTLGTAASAQDLDKLLR